MTKAASLYQFFSSFGMPAYTATSVPDDVTFPYLTYELITSAWGGEPVGLTVNLWFYTTSEAVPNAKAEELSEAISLGGKIIPCDGGYIWLKRGTPWCQSLSDETSPTIKRRYINVTAEYLTKN
ncbi:hypothetical protein D1159_03870 [Pseudoflavonifractor sp. 524-17]|uniref:hypothetical protein n=1 Tax=Pseudoflavonifractor sp. 524-17 TaxID=2304577 RepID=UPI001379701D|nr:hypothetical protein [Pseudoflavonifractor sp. 524-17]NCE63737.1 hypothetical protein [Pseudoflavonifractor sp. 524-17]